MDTLEKLTSGDTFLRDNATVVFVDTAEGLQDVVAQLLSAEIIGLDIETAKLTNHELAGLIPCVSRIRLVQLYNGETCYVADVNKVGIDWLRLLEHKCMVAHNAQFDAAHLLHASVDLKNLHCSMLAGRVFVGERGLKLRELSKAALGIVVEKDQQTSDWGADNLTDAQITYAALDAVLTYQLWHQYGKLFLLPEAAHYRDTYEFLRSLLRPMTKQLLQGVFVDIEAHAIVVRQWRDDLESTIVELSSLGLVQAPLDKKERAAMKKNGARFISSTKDKQSVLRERLTGDELSAWPLTKTGG